MDCRLECDHYIEEKYKIVKIHCLDAREQTEYIFKTYGLDFNVDHYWQTPAYDKFIHEFRGSSWIFEKNLVGKERIREIYGKYGMGVEWEKTEKYERREWINYLSDKYPESTRTYKDISRLIFRNEEKDGKFGLIQRMKKLGIDLEKFVEDEKWAKLVCFLYCYEIDHQMEVTQLLAKPTLENVDNSIVGEETRNGSYIFDLRYNVRKELSDDYVQNVGNAIQAIGIMANGAVNEIMGMTTEQEVEAFTALLEERKKISEGYLRTHNQYLDSAMETFYLKIEQHQMLGRQNDILELLRKYQTKTYTDLCDNPIYEQFRNRDLSKSKCRTELIENRKNYTKLVFGKDKVSSNDLKKYDRAVNMLDGFMEILLANTPWGEASSLPVLAVVSLLQEIIENKEITEVSFYHWETNDKKRRTTELYNGIQALKKNQIEWIQNIRTRYNMMIGNGKIWRLRCKAEELVQEILINILNTNSLEQMIELYKQI